MSSLFALEERLKKLETEHGVIKEAVDRNTVIVTKSAADTEEILAVLAGAKLAIQLLIVLGRIIKWTGVIAVGCGSIWALLSAIQSGHPPALGK